MIAYEIVRDLCKRNNITAQQLEKKLNLSNGYVYSLKNAKHATDRLRLISDFFEVPYEYLTTGEMPDYYENKESNELAQFLFEHPEHRVLFDASKKIKKEDLEVVLKLLEKFGE